MCLIFSSNANNIHGGDYLKKDKTQTQKILDGFVTTVVLITSLTLVASGIAVSRMNTEYLETGVESAKIVAERDSRQIFISDSESTTYAPERDYSFMEKILSFLPPPVNTVYLALREFRNAVFEPDK